MNNVTTIFPAQKLPLKRKNKEWGQHCMDYIIGMGETVPSGAQKTSFEEMQTYYDLYNSIFNEKDLKYVTDPYMQDDGFPATIQDFNIIRPKIDLLLGEETKHPFNYKVIRTSQDAASDMQDKMKQMMIEYTMAEMMSGMTPEAAADFQSKLASGELTPPEKIAEYMGKSYKDVAEDCAYHTLNYLKEKLGLDHEFYKGWKDALIAGKEVYYTGIVNGEPHMERVNPLYFAHDNAPDLEFIEDGDWAVRRMRLSYTEVYDRLYDKMTEKELDALIEMTGQKPSTGMYGVDAAATDYMHVNMHSVGGAGNDTVTRNNHVNLWHAVWKSYKKVGFVTVLGDDGTPQETIVSEDYMAIGNELNIEWKWVIEIWEGYRFGMHNYVGVQPVEYQFTSTDTLNSQKLPYCGVLYSNTNSRSKSLVAIMKPLQYMYIIIWYRLELAIARDKGKVITMDITQIPKSMNIDAAKWMHYLSAVGVNFINPYEEGWDIPGREGGKPAQFNQISALDLTMANVIDQYINLMSKIEDMISEISGVSRQRMGEIQPSELVGNVNAANSGSANITAPLFWMHNQCKKNSLRMLLNTAKEAWRTSNRKNIQYVMSDSTRTFMKLAENFFYEDYDIFVSDSSKDLQNLEQLRSLYQPAMQNGASLLDVAEIMTLDSVTQIKTKLKSIYQQQAEQQQQAQQQEQQNQMQQIQAQNDVKQQEVAIKQQELDLTKYKIDADNQTRIAVAEMSIYKGMENQDLDNNGVPDVMEIADLSLRRSEHDANVMDKQMQSAQKERELSTKKEIESRKLDIERENAKRSAEIEKNKIDLENKKMELQLRLQKMKDSSALEREKLKAKVAIKNKVTGEK